MKKKLTKSQIDERDTAQRPTIVCSAFVKKNGKFLFVFDPKFKTWRVPGGRSDFGEKLEDALKREMKEEINIEAKNLKFLGFGQDLQYHFGHKENKSRVIMYFFVKVTGKVVVDKREALEYKWVSLNEIKKEKNKEGALTDFFKKYPKLKL